MQRKNYIPDTGTSYKELTKYCVSNVSADDTESQIKFMIDNGILENRPSNQELNSFLYYIRMYQFQLVEMLFKSFPVVTIYNIVEAKSVLV